MPPVKNEVAKVIELRRLEDTMIEVPVEGVTPVIPHRWSEKALKQMRDKQMAEAGSLASRREPKNPDEEAEASCYWLDLKEGTDLKRYGAIPSVSFKTAMVASLSLFPGSGLTKIATKPMLFVEGDDEANELVKITGPWSMREDTPRNASGTPDLRYRMQFWPWSATLRVHFLPSLITAESVLALVDAAGRLGVGDWRPSSPRSASGTYGQFRVEMDEVKEG